ncbi:MAG: malonate decarboxylase holo-ACP synthase [Vibrio sp.]
MISAQFPAHTLLWVEDVVFDEVGSEEASLDSNAERPDWCKIHDKTRPVVVRRAENPNLIPVGIRGQHRSERAAAWVDPKQIIRALTPDQLVQNQPWLEHYSKHPLKQIDALESIESIFNYQKIRWGLGGSIGFELATSIITANENSDLDLIAYSPKPISNQVLAELWQNLIKLDVQMDVQIETPNGAFALREWLQCHVSLKEQGKSPQPVMMKTPLAPVLMLDPWG